MTLVTLIILPISMLLIGFVMKHSQKYFRGQQEYLGNVNGQVEEVFLIDRNPPRIATTT